MSLWDDLKKKAIDANPELAAKAAQAMEKARELAVEAGQKAAPLLKEASEKATAYAQEKTPVLKAQALKAIDDAKVRRAALREQAKRDKAARAEMIRTMYDITLEPGDVNFIEEPFHHFERQFAFFMVTGEVLDTQKRNHNELHASHYHNGGGGYMHNGYGSISGGSSSMQVSSTSVQEHEFWIRDDEDGKESCFKVHDSSLSLRAGQKVSMVFMHPADSRTGKMVALYNHNAERNYVINGPQEINRLFGIYLEEPGFFNQKEVTETRQRLLQALDQRIGQLAHYMALHGKRSGHLIEGGE
ncbi:hypothetical protein V0R50_00785 [Pseudomonas sp. 148P]|uniref:Uncharacterized protein n=1 Tax=Pseudomonas ulcerans TaxID=3115852 RepID=A0ABU7HJP8_9PSED|nr:MULTISPECIES: hypothetical protein [unclassified Pseudomonas]MEE1921455.1 hypothetical protein [Pseudomonas sp. 147P]MEE1931738.1 hypothetical protein [Pseudomonas sp. 148P]